MELVSPWEIFGGADFFALSFSNTLSCAPSMLLNSNAAAAAVSSSLHLNFSTYFFIAYSFPIFRAQPNNNNSPKVIKVTTQGKITSLQIYFTIVVCTSSTSCINRCTTAANISSVIRRSGKPAKFNFKCDNKFWWISPISSGGITSSNSFSPSNKGRSKGVGKIRTISLDSWIHVRGSGVRNKPAFGSCNLPLHEGLTKQLWQPGTRISPCSVKFCIVKSPFADVKRYVESNKYRACGCWGSATNSWAHSFRTVAGRLKYRPVKQVVFCDLVVENSCLHRRSRCEPQQWVESSCSVTSAKFVLSHDINKCVFDRWYCVARSVCGIGWGIGVARNTSCTPCPV